MKDAKSMDQVREHINITIEPFEGGFFVDSEDLPTLNLLVQEEHMLTVAIPQAIKYLYKHNRKVDVRILMEVPIFETPEAANKSTREELEVIELPLAA